MARNAGVPPTVHTDPASVRREVPRTVHEDKFNVEKFIMNGAKVFISRTDSIQAKSWINVTQTVFRALQVPNCHKTRLGTCMLQEEAYQMVEDHKGDKISTRGHELHHLGGVCGSL